MSSFEIHRGQPLLLCEKYLVTCVSGKITRRICKNPSRNVGKSLAGSGIKFESVDEFIPTGRTSLFP